jgi:hypothetical protein
MHTHVYQVKPDLLIPTVAITDDGFFIEIEPIAALSSPGSAQLATALDQVRLRGNPQVRTPSRAAFPKPAVLSYTKARSWSDFEKRAHLWKLKWDADGVSVTPTRLVRDGGFEDLEDQRKLFQGDTCSEDVARHLLGLSQ